MNIYKVRCLQKTKVHIPRTNDVTKLLETDGQGRSWYAEIERIAWERAAQVSIDRQ